MAKFCLLQDFQRWQIWTLLALIFIFVNSLFFSFVWDLVHDLMAVRTTRIQKQVEKMSGGVRALETPHFAEFATALTESMSLKTSKTLKIEREEGNITSFDDTFPDEPWYGGDAYTHERFTVVMSTYGNYSNNHYLEDIIASFYNLSYYIQEIVICWDPPQYGYKDFFITISRQRHSRSIAPLHDE